MILVVDANRIFSAIIRDGPTRRDLLTCPAHLVAPTFLREEIERHRPLFERKSGLTHADLDALLGVLLERIAWVPDDRVQHHIARASEALPNDPKDVPYLACALAMRAAGIWSQDQDFDAQDLVPRYETPSRRARPT